MKDRATFIMIIVIVSAALLCCVYIAGVTAKDIKKEITASEKRIVKQIQNEFEDAELICPDKTMLPYEIHGLEKQKCKHRRFNPWRECE